MLISPVILEKIDNALRVTLGTTSIYLISLLLSAINSAVVFGAKRFDKFTISVRQLALHKVCDANHDSQNDS